MIAGQPADTVTSTWYGIWLSLHLYVRTYEKIMYQMQEKEEDYRMAIGENLTRGSMNPQGVLKPHRGYTRWQEFYTVLKNAVFIKKRFSVLRQDDG